MKHLTLKEEYKGVIISKLYPGIGNITFDPAKVKPESYKNYIQFGFDHIFDEIETCDTCLELICICQQADNSKSTDKKTEDKLPTEKGKVAVKKITTVNNGHKRKTSKS